MRREIQNVGINGQELSSISIYGPSAYDDASAILACKTWKLARMCAQEGFNNCNIENPIIEREIQLMICFSR